VSKPLDSPRSKNPREQSKHSRFIAALNSNKQVSGLTHIYYRYPARFSPEFAREAIQLFTRPGDLVLDPFLGGGTSGVEAVATGRRFVGTDINPLAHFVSGVKTKVLSPRDVDQIASWIERVHGSFHINRRETQSARWESYQKNVPWRIRRGLAYLLASLQHLPSTRQRAFARCSILSAGQWALDCRSHVPGISELLIAHRRIVTDMIAGNAQFRRSVTESYGRSSSPACGLYCTDAALLSKNAGLRKFGRPKLVLTSPPYLGVHVLYHRWQVLGRRETPAPYWIANRPDGHGGAFYTFADRKSISPERYLKRLQACFTAIREVSDRRTQIVQLVAFPDADVQLPIYLGALADVGLQHCESFDTNLRGTDLTRDVPNRRWYAEVNKQSHSSREFLLVHRLRQR
jgi:hypothetical protein